MKPQLEVVTSDDILGDWLSADYLKMPEPAMREVGQPTQMLGAILRVGDHTFRSVEGLAEVACLPERTARRHLDALVEAGWLTRGPRGKTARGRTRRTKTYSLTEHALKNAKPFGRLPRWAARELATWAERCLFSVIVARHVIRSWLEEEHHRDDFDFLQTNSLRELVERIGLTRPSIREAKRQLAVGRWIEVERQAGYGDLLRLNLNRPIEIARANSGRLPRQEVAVDGAKSGSRGGQKVAV